MQLYQICFITCQLPTCFDRFCNHHQSSITNVQADPCIPG